MTYCLVVTLHFGLPHSSWRFVSNLVAFPLQAIERGARALSSGYAVVDVAAKHDVTSRLCSSIGCRVV